MGARRTPNPRRPPAERFWAFVDRSETGCWLWRGNLRYAIQQQTVSRIVNRKRWGHL